MIEFSFFKLLDEKLPVSPTVDNVPHSILQIFLFCIWERVFFELSHDLTVYKLCQIGFNNTTNSKAQLRRTNLGHNLSLHWCQHGLQYIGAKGSSRAAQAIPLQGSTSRTSAIASIWGNLCWIGPPTNTYITMKELTVGSFCDSLYKSCRFLIHFHCLLLHDCYIILEFIMFI